MKSPRQMQSKYTLSRRRFVAVASAVGILGPLGSLSAQLAEPILRPIPSSGERIPIVGLGTARTFNVNRSDPTAMAARRDVLENFFNAGGRLVDSSPMYGEAEAVVGALATQLGIADELFMATKVWTRGREAGIRQMERSAQRMGGGPLELIQVHNLVDTETHLDTLKAWKREGRIRYLGVTHYTAGSHDRLARLCERLPLDFVQFNYNIQERNAEQRLLPAARDNGVATLINEPFESGALFNRVRGQPLPEWAEALGISSWGQYFLKFILGHPAVTCAIPATSKAKHVLDNMGAALDPLPDERQRERMLAYLKAL